MTGEGPLSFEIQLAESRVSDEDRERILQAPGFGQVFTDHMVTARWVAERGWHDGKLEPYGPFTMDPATSVFHYAQEFYEGLKAYKTDGGAVVTFRADRNAARFNTGARRMAMPEFPEESFLEAVELLVSTDRAWIPAGEAAGEGNSLYVRPFMIATGRGLGINRPSAEYLFCAIASPAAAYFGANATVTVWLSQDYTRAAPGGTGAVKCGGNYAAAFAGQQEAVANGCDQVVWLDSAEHRWVEEMGGMNLFFVYKDRMVTPPLTGTLLPGITRDSLLSLAPSLGIPVEEDRISVEQWRGDCASGELTEVFACGTAAVITPVGRARSASGDWVIGDGTPGPVSMRLREELIGIQYGHRPDPFGWVHKVC